MAVGPSIVALAVLDVISNGEQVKLFREVSTAIYAGTWDITAEGMMDGAADGTKDGVADGTIEGVVEGMMEGNLGLLLGLNVTGAFDGLTVLGDMVGRIVG